jgi:hypothetical protein
VSAARHDTARAAEYHARRMVRTRIVVETATVVVASILLAWALLATDGWIATHTTRRYCFTDEAGITRAHVARFVAGALALVLLVLVALVRPWLVRRFEGRSPSSVGAAAIRILGAVVLAFVVTDLVLRLRAPERHPPPLGFAHEPKQTLTVHAKSGRDVHYAVDSNGYRSRTPDDVVDFSAPTIIFGGESIMFGAWLEYDETIPALVGKELDVQTVNLGVGGMANDLSLMRLERELLRFEKPTAVVTLVLVNWLERNAGEDRDHYVASGDGIRLAPPTTPSFLRASPLFSALRIATRFHSDAALDSTRAVLRATDALAKKHGARSLFVFTQAGDRCLAPDLRERITRGLDLRAIDVDLPQHLFIPGDTHPVPEGAAVYAKAITAELR